MWVTSTTRVRQNITKNQPGSRHRGNNRPRARQATYLQPVQSEKQWVLLRWTHSITGSMYSQMSFNTKEREVYISTWMYKIKKIWVRRQSICAGFVHRHCQQKAFGGGTHIHHSLFLFLSRRQKHQTAKWKWRCVEWERERGMCHRGSSRYDAHGDRRIKLDWFPFLGWSPFRPITHPVRVLILHGGSDGDGFRIIIAHNPISVAPCRTAQWEKRRMCVWYLHSPWLEQKAKIITKDCEKGLSQSYHRAF